MFKEINKTRKDLTYNKGILISMISGGFLILILLIIYEILAFLSYKIFGLFAMFLVWLPHFIFINLGNKYGWQTPSIVIVSLIFWFIIGCLINLILYSVNKPKK